MERNHTSRITTLSSYTQKSWVGVIGWGGKVIGWSGYIHSSTNWGKGTMVFTSI